MRPSKQSWLRVEPLEDRCVLSGNVILDWNELLLQSLPGPMSPIPMARNMALVHVAMFDAVNAIDRSYESYHVKAHAARGASQVAAAAQAAHDTLAALYPARQAVFAEALKADLAGIDPVRARQGAAIGQRAAREILQLRSDDGSSATVSYTPPNNNPGQWQPTGSGDATGAHISAIAPFAVASSSQFRPGAHPALSSDAYASDYNQARLVGARDAESRDRDGDGKFDRTAEQTQVAMLWRLPLTNHLVWNRIAQDVAETRGLSLPQSARLFALLNMGLNDGLQTSFGAKFHYGLWRPVTAIHNGGVGGPGDADGNPDTVGEAGWLPLHPSTPPYPTYSGNASTIGATCATVLAGFFGRDDIRIEVPFDSYGFPGVTRSFAGFWAAAEEQADSRVYGGIHFNFDSTAGQQIGGDVGRHVLGNFLLPRRHGGGKTSGFDACPRAANPVAILSARGGPAVTGPTLLVGLQTLPAQGQPAPAGQGFGGGISRSAAGTVAAGRNALDALFGGLAATRNDDSFDLFW
jgi:hypothetical protein